MNNDTIKATVVDIVGLWNKKDFKSRQYAKGKLKLVKWFLPRKTYNYLAVIMGEMLLPEDEKTITEQVEVKDVLVQAQQIFGGKIIDK
jgi:hypothetical protein